MLWETLERVNRLRQQALANPEFVQSAKEHYRSKNITIMQRKSVQPKTNKVRSRWPISIKK